MKSMVLASLVVMGSASVALAEVTLSGSGRFGLNYDSALTDRETQIELRFRTEFNGKTETDSGMTFGGRVRMQYSVGTVNDNDDVVGPRSGATLNAAYVYAESNGFRVEFGNANTAYDSVFLMYNSEIGFLDRSSGDPGGTYFSYDSGPYSNTPNRVGTFMSYSAGDLNVRLSTITLDQTSSNSASEISVSADYAFGKLTVAGAYAKDGGSIIDNDLFFVGAEYAVTDAANIGLLYFDNGSDGAGVDVGKRVTLYGNTTFGAVKVAGYVSNDDGPANATDTAYGIGASYDLGGATLAGSVQRSFADETFADIGVNFSF